MGTPQTPYRGSMVAIVTPFKEGVFDDAAFDRLIDIQLSNGTAGIVPCGTTGESATLTHEEHRRVVAHPLTLPRLSPKAAWASESVAMATLQLYRSRSGFPCSRLPSGGQDTPMHGDVSPSGEAG